MKVLLVVHGYPPELIGGTELNVQSAARGLVAAGHDVTVAAGSLRWDLGPATRVESDRDPASGREFHVHRIQRTDLYFEHWQKSRCDAVSSRFREVLATTRPDVVHVHHWIRLSDDLIRVAAREGVPSVATLHDLWTTCARGFRLRPVDFTVCDAAAAPDPCVGCVADLRPKTPWLDPAAQDVRMQRRVASLGEELRAANVVLCLSRAQRDVLARHLPFLGERLIALPHGRDAVLAPSSPIPSPGDLGRLILGSWGAVHALKGTDLLVEAIAGLREEGMPVELRVAGREVDPEFAAALRRRAAGLRVEFFGEFPERGLSDHPVGQVHAMVSGTRAEETWGVVVDEAIELGLPLLLPRSGALPEHIGEDRSALFYRARDPADLTRVIEDLRRDPDGIARLRRRSPALGEVVPTMEAYVRRLIDVYVAAIANGPRVRSDPHVDVDEGDDGIAAWDAQARAHSPAELGLPGSTPEQSEVP